MQVCVVLSDTYTQTLGGLLWPQMKPRQRLKMFIDVQSIRTTTKEKKKKKKDLQLCFSAGLENV